MHVLFICPHGAAKSVIAAAMLNDLARRRHIEITVSSAGIDPDDEIHPIAVETLMARQLPVPDTPQLVTKNLVEQADIVVSLGCALDQIPTRPGRWIDWSDAPGASEDVTGLCGLLSNRLGTLLT